MDARAPSPRLRSAAVLAPMVAAFLLMPPFIGLFTAPLAVFGIPLIVLYLFGVWAGLIVLTWVLARRLAAAEDEPAAPASEADTPPPA